MTNNTLKNKIVCRFSSCCIGDLFIQVGLAFIFLYAGIAILTDPFSWIGYIPSFFEDIGLGLSRETLLKMHGVFDIILGLWILSGFWRMYAGIIAGITLVFITGFSGIESLVVTFRNIGLACMALSYAASNRYCKHKNDIKKEKQVGV